MTPKQRKLTADRLRELLDYNPDSGLFTWRIDRYGRVKAGSSAGIICAGGHVLIQIDGESCWAHRLAWLWMTGQWPMDRIDHRNRIKHDNRWSNLREATLSEDRCNRGIQPNNTSGFKGVCFDRKPNLKRPWMARAKFQGKNYHIGYFATPEEAHKAYREFITSLHGEFASPW